MRLRRYKKLRGEYSDLQPAAPEPIAIPVNRPPEKTVLQTVSHNYPMRLVRRIFSNPNFNYQLMMISLVLLSDNVPMDRHLNGLTTTVDKIRNVTEVMSGTMSSLKVAAEAPRNIRRLFE